MSATSAFTVPCPSHSDEVKTSFPQDHVMVISFNRPRSLNAMTPQMESDIKKLLDWFDEEPGLWVVIITGEGRAFCAGADLKAWFTRQQNGQSNEQEYTVASFNGFGSISRRLTSKPMIAAVNGGAFGGGVEMLMNCDLVIASQEAVFALPEVKRGVVASAGVIPRIRATAGHQLASEMLLLGRTVGAAEAHQRFGFVNAVVPKEKLMSTAVEWATQITQNSPDAVQCSKRGLITAAQHADFEQAVATHTWSPESKRLYKGYNIKEGLRAFSEQKRKPNWKNPAKL
ncbi:ClpP/crotonase [Dentipellis sp. KUC8613]|nr:ClpP/crotonase [Dentipellis sp. KUC8613]